MASVFRSITRSTMAAAAALALVSTPGAGFATGPDGASADEGPFLSENEKAMTKMMDDMSVKPTGNVDQDFVAMMVPHHQGAIDMAQAELRFGHNEQLRRIAQEIIVGQQQEIVAMRLALGQPLPSPAPTPDQQAPASHPTPAQPMSRNGGHLNSAMNAHQEP